MFKQDGKLLYYGTKLGNLMWLQVLVLLTCLPVITIGTSLTAMHTVLLQLYRDEETSISKEFFAAFKVNFKQATLLWLIYLAAFGLLILDFMILASAENMFLKMTLQLLPLPFLFLCVTLVWVFILQSRYENTLWNTLKNAFLMFIYRFFPSLFMIILTAAPIVAGFLLPTVFPVVLLLGITIPGILCAAMYSKVFDHLEGVERTPKQE